MGSDYPPVAVVMTTYLPEGEDGARRALVNYDTLASWNKYLAYEGDLWLHVADDGSRAPLASLGPWKIRLLGMSYQERHGVGASLNTGFRFAFDNHVPITAYFVDDWCLTSPLDITPWVRLLMEREDVGMVRLGPPHPNTTGTVEAFTSEWQSWGLRMDRYAYAFGHRPALYHKRMIDAYGWFKEDCNALVCEQDYAERFCRMEGPDIVLALPHPWQHLDSVELADVDPR